MAFPQTYKLFNTTKHQMYDNENNNIASYSPPGNPYAFQNQQQLQLHHYNNDYLNQMPQAQQRVDRSPHQPPHSQQHISHQQQLQQLHHIYLQQHQQQLHQQQCHHQQQQQQLQQQQQTHLYRQYESPKKYPPPPPDAQSPYDYERSHSFNSLEPTKGKGSSQKKSGRSLASLFSPLIFRSQKSQSSTIFPFLSGSKNKHRATSTCNIGNGDGPYGFHHSAQQHHQPPQQKSQQAQMHNISAAAVLDSPATRSTSNITAMTNNTRLSVPDGSPYNFSTSQRSCPGSLKRIKSSPLTAQQATYETMRTIDMYLIRQIARNCMNYELERKIELEIRMRELTAQAMLEAETELELLEVEKALLVSDQRMHCYAMELEQQRKRLSTPSLASSTLDSGRGSTVAGRRQVARAGAGADVVGGELASSESPSSPQLAAKWSPVSGESALTSQSGHSSSLLSSSLNNNNNNNNTAEPDTNNITCAAAADDQQQQHQQQLQGCNTLDRKHRSRQRSRHRRDQFRRTIGVVGGSALEQHLAVGSRLLIPSPGRPARVSVGEIRIPLLWRDADHFKGRGEYKRFAAFCLVRINSEVRETQLISDVDRTQIDLTFPDELLVFPEVRHNFELRLEVYSCVYIEQLTLGSTPRKLREKLASSVSRAMGRRLAAQTASANYIKELEAYDKSYRFSLIASASLGPHDADTCVKTYDLALVSSASLSPSSLVGGGRDQVQLQHHLCQRPTGAQSRELQRNSLPLFGNLCCHLQVEPLAIATGGATTCDLFHRRAAHL